MSITYPQIVALPESKKKVKWNIDVDPTDC